MKVDMEDPIRIPDHGRIHLFLILFFIQTFLLMSSAMDRAWANNEKDLTDLSISKLMEIEVPTVYGASKYNQRVTDAPSSVTIVTGRDIKAYGYRNLAEILRGIRGMYLTYDRNYHYLGIRGFASHGDYNSRFLLLIDGHRLNDNVYGQASLGTDFILDIDLIDRIEVIRGPSSSVYGTSAFLGVINVVTRKGRDIGGFEASGEIASNKTYKGRISYGKYYDNGMEAVLSATGYDSGGEDRLYYREFDHPFTNNGVAEKMDSDGFKSAFASLDYKDLTIQSGFVSREKTIPTAPWEVDFNDPVLKSVDDRGYVDIKYRHFFSNTVGLSGRIYYDYYEYEGSYPFSSVVNKDSVEGNWWGAEMQMNAHIGQRHQATVGGEYVDVFKNSQKNYDESPFFPYFDDNRKMSNWAVYLLDEFDISKHITLSAGVRHDHYESFGGTTNPRLALIFRPVENTTIKFIYGQAFRAPSPYELYYNDGNISQKENPYLKPETIKTYELILEKYFKDHLRFGISLYNNKFKDLITFKTDPADGLLVFDNIDRVETIGTEVEVEKLWQNGFKALVSYAYQDSKTEGLDQRLGNSPRHLVKLHLIFPILKDKLTAGLEEDYMSKRLLISGSEAGEAFITNLTFFSHNMIKGLEISLSAYNLFNVTYEDPASQEHLQDQLEQDGRGLRLKVIYRF